MDGAETTGLVRTAPGWCALIWTSRGVRRLSGPFPTRAGALRAIGESPGQRSERVVRRAVPSRWARALRAYLGGGGTLRKIPVEKGLWPPFRRRVLGVTRRIPPGQVRTYGWVASRAGHPRAARAVGQALKWNPVPLLVPCHRVVASTGLGGFSGGLSRKRWLLRLEGR